jgi:hypothetical protein
MPSALHENDVGRRTADTSRSLEMDMPVPGPADSRSRLIGQGRNVLCAIRQGDGRRQIGPTVQDCQLLPIAAVPKTDRAAQAAQLGNMHAGNRAVSVAGEADIRRSDPYKNDRKGGPVIVGRVETAWVSIPDRAQICRRTKYSSRQIWTSPARRNWRDWLHRLGSQSKYTRSLSSDNSRR